MSKRADGPYAGRRTRSWLKTKCGRRQEFVVGGFTEPSGARHGFGALLLGVHDEEGALRYAGRVGSGFDDATLARLAKRLRALERRTPPFADPPRGAQARGVHWASPSLVAEVAFTEWTGDGQLRHPVFKGLREDKPAAEVVREMETRAGDPGAAAGAGAPCAAEDDRAAPGSRAGAIARSRAGARRGPGAGRAPSSPARLAAQADRRRRRHQPSRPRRLPRPRAHQARRGRVLRGGRRPHGAVPGAAGPHRHPLPRRDRLAVLLPEERDAVGPALGRPRCACAAPTEKTVVYPVVDTPEGLLAMVQNGAVEFHVWGSGWARSRRRTSSSSTSTPTPDAGLAPRARGGAHAARRSWRAAAWRASSGPPAARGSTWSCRSPRARAGRAWARSRARWSRRWSRASRDKYTATMSKAKRGGKVFVDHFRNGRGATSVTSYSLRGPRGRPGRPAHQLGRAGQDPRGRRLDGRARAAAPARRARPTPGRTSSRRAGGRSCRTPNADEVRHARGEPAKDREPSPAIRLKRAYETRRRDDGVQGPGGAPVAARPEQGARGRRPLAQGRGAEPGAAPLVRPRPARSGPSSAAATATSCASRRRSWSSCAGSPARAP